MMRFTWGLVLGVILVASSETWYAHHLGVSWTEATGASCWKEVVRARAERDYARTQIPLLKE